MGTKRTPQLVAKAKRLRADGRSYQDIAEELSKLGTPVSKASVVIWLRDTKGSSRDQNRPPDPVAETRAPVPVGELDTSPMPPDHFRGLLAGNIRALQAENERCKAIGDHVGATRAMKMAAQYAAMLAKAQARDDDGEYMRVRTADMTAAAERARSKLHDLISRLASERGR